MKNMKAAADGLDYDFSNIGPVSPELLRDCLLPFIKINSVTQNSDGHIDIPVLGSAFRKRHPDLSTRELVDLILRLCATEDMIYERLSEIRGGKDELHVTVEDIRRVTSGQFFNAAASVRMFEGKDDKRGSYTDYDREEMKALLKFN